MDTAQANLHKPESRILKSNLWKFFKILRVQANPLYCLLEASPIHYARIAIIDKADPEIRRWVTIRQFIRSLRRMPSSQRVYRLEIWCCTPSCEPRIYCHEVVNRQDLAVEQLIGRFREILAFHLLKARQQGTPLELTPEQVSRYRFKQRYLEELSQLIAEINEQLVKGN